MMTAPAELYRDPVYDGATDPLVVIDEATGWWMFYTQRRATHPDPGPGVAWVHGSRIGVARSDDGVDWRYAGTLEPGAAGGLTLSADGPPALTDRTHWAPEVIHDGDGWRMYLTEIDGVPDQWPGHARTIVEYRSDDLAQWRRIAPLSLASDRVIDAAVARTPGGWRLWYKDEAAGSVTKSAVSGDLEGWTDQGTAIGGRPHEGPAAFSLGGWWWLIVDEWRGMGVYRSPDAETWQRQGGWDDVILAPGTLAGATPGNHGAAVRDGDRVWFYFFSQPTRSAGIENGEEVADDRRCAVYRVELTVDAGVLSVR